MGYTLSPMGRIRLLRNGSFSECSETHGLHIRFYGSFGAAYAMARFLDVSKLMGCIIDVEHRICVLPRCFVF